MKRMLLSSVLTVLVFSLGIGQQSIPSLTELTIKLFNENGDKILEKKYEGLAADDFEMADLLELDEVETAMLSRVTAFGHYMKEEKKNYVFFDTGVGADVVLGDLCKVAVSKVKPLIGVSVKSTANFDGVRIERKTSTNPLSGFGLAIGDVIHTFNGYEVDSYCKLSHAVNDCKVGQKVPAIVTINGKAQTKYLTVGSTIRTKITFKDCTDLTNDETLVSDMDNFTYVELSVYPNPTKELAHFTYNSDSDAPVSFYVVDINGATIHSQDFSEFTGSIKETFSFGKAPAGTYIFVTNQEGTVSRKKVLYLGK